MPVAERNNPPIRLPDRRRLRTYAFDPMSTRLSGRLLLVDVPFEKDLQPGPVGELIHVVDYDATRDLWYAPVDLDDPAILAQDGLRPTEGDPRTHQQIVYAVSMSVLERFERFVGRRFRWRSSHALRLVPHAFEGRNAFFDPTRRAVLFGYYTADARDPGANLPGQVMFTCLSSDVIAHEVTHAIVHRLRRYYSEATNPDVFAWHEAFADLVALFQHFAHREVVIEAVAATRGDLRGGGGLLDLAREFGASTGRGKALRSALGTDPDPTRFQNATEPHERGACFVAGVFDAYLDAYQSRIGDLLRIYTNGTGVLPEGNLHPDLVRRVADEAVTAADRVLGMVVRGFDYLPVVDVTFGDVVRAVVTADRALYPEDGGHLRSGLVEALRKRGIYPSRVASLTDEALVWPAPSQPLTLSGQRPHIDLARVIRAATQDLDPTGAAGDSEGDASDLEDSADEDGTSHLVDRKKLGIAVRAWAKRHALALGFEPTLDVSLLGIHVAYRTAADRQPRPEIVLQLSQRRRDLEDQSLPVNKRTVLRAGTTLLASVDGRVDYLVMKPLPLLEEPPATDPAGREVHRLGLERLAAMHGWFAQTEQADALSAWTNEPAALRLTFAALHEAIEGSA
jgi:hypothetical protein